MRRFPKGCMRGGKLSLDLLMRLTFPHTHVDFSEIIKTNDLGFALMAQNLRRLYRSWAWTGIDG